MKYASVLLEFINWNTRINYENIPRGKNKIAGNIKLIKITNNQKPKHLYL